MRERKQILVIEDHRETLEFLRSLLELADERFHVLAVPSAEEAYLELRQRPYDLLLTDVHLPGMSGIELVRRIRALRPDMPVLVMTAYASSQVQQEATELGAVGYFPKPLDSAALLAAVRRLLLEQGGPVEATPKPDSGASKPPAEQQLELLLKTLQTDTGAVQVVLADMNGELLFTAIQTQVIDIRAVSAQTAFLLQSSRTVSDLLSDPQSRAIHYQAGSRYDFYAANVGRNHFLMLLFEAHTRRGRIGTVWVFTQRAVGELTAALADRPAAAAKPEGDSRTGEEREEPRALDTSGHDIAEKGPGPERKSGEPAISPDMAADVAMSALFATELPDASDVDLDAFWDEALDDEDVEWSGTGLSFEEARRQRLIPPDFGESNASEPDDGA